MVSLGIFRAQIRPAYVADHAFSACAFFVALADTPGEWPGREGVTHTQWLGPWQTTGRPPSSQAKLSLVSAAMPWKYSIEPERLPVAMSGD
jgi:hypothetical protein